MSEQLQSAEARPGFAKRAEHFQDHLERARAWRWSAGQTIERVQRAVLYGTPGLTEKARRLLLIYADELNQKRLEQDIATVWPGSDLLEELLDCDERTVRRSKEELEAAGWIIRDNNKANRPNGHEAIDLRPTVQRLAEMEAYEDAAREAARARRAA